ncbi:MAG: FadR/GntR family transcriptional regulator [Pseudomonadota bacterium]
MERSPQDGGLTRSIYEQLSERIRAGIYATGSRLPSELELAGEFEVSRPIVRGALARLRDEGVIVSRQGSGSFVTEGKGLGEGFAPLGSVEDFAAWYDYRRVIEAEIAARAARHAAEDKLATLTTIADELDRLLDEGGSGVEVDMRFHAAIADMAENRFLQETVAMLQPHLYFIARFVRSLGYTGYLSGETEARSEHRAIVEAIAAGDAERARRAMIEHINGSQRRVFKGTGKQP